MAQEDSTDNESMQGEEEWEDWEDDGNEIGLVKCLFSDDVFASAEEAMRYDAKENDFDLEAVRSKYKLTFYDTIRLINYIRSEINAATNPKVVRAAIEHGEVDKWCDEKYYMPVVENDPFISMVWSSMDDVQGDTRDDQVNFVMEELENLDLEDKAVRDLITNPADWHDVSKVEENTEDDRRTERVDDSYFESYSFMDIHKEMLQDHVRTVTYRNALEENPSLMKGSHVLDVGCGTGVLSIFASRGGAEKVVAVDGSTAIAKVAEKICRHNGFCRRDMPGRISVVASKIENLEWIPCESEDGKVDVIVSEWMGYALLFESMLDSVLVARDTFLRQGGAILPDIANIYLTMGSPAAEDLSFWNNVYGIDMNPVAESLRNQYLRQGLVRPVQPHEVISDSVLVKSFDLAHMAREDQDFSSHFKIITQNISVCSCLVLWFDTEFSARFCMESPQLLSTSPHQTQTHWAQTVLPLKEPLLLNRKDEDVTIGLEGLLTMTRRKAKHRTLDIVLEYQSVRSNGSHGPKISQIYSMGVH